MERMRLNESDQYKLYIEFWHQIFSDFVNYLIATCRTFYGALELMKPFLKITCFYHEGYNFFVLFVFCLVMLNNYCKFSLNPFLSSFLHLHLQININWSHLNPTRGKCRSPLCQILADWITSIMQKSDF